MSPSSPSGTSTGAESSTAEATSSSTSQASTFTTFKIDIEYNGPWNATAIGYSNTTANQVFLKYYSGLGNSTILINDWNPGAGAILNLVIHKMDASGANLTAIGTGGQAVGVKESTVAPYGIVNLWLDSFP